MPRVAPVVPAEADLLCEGCGYILNGLGVDGNCPECGKPIKQSIGQHRQLSEFEQGPGVRTFLHTTTKVILHPGRFYRHLATRQDTPASRTFERLHRGVAAGLLALAATGHLLWVWNNFGSNRRPGAILALTTVALAGLAATDVMLAGLTRLAAWLSAIEAQYWGMRLPYHVVRRGMRFHACHYLPVGILAAVIVWSYRLAIWLNMADAGSAVWYLYGLCAAVVLCAVYLFQTYWIAMRNMMYANR